MTFDAFQKQECKFKLILVNLGYCPDASSEYILLVEIAQQTESLEVHWFYVLNIKIYFITILKHNRQTLFFEVITDTCWLTYAK